MAPRARLNEFLDGDGIPGEHPVAAAEHAALLRFVGVGVGHDEQFGCDLRRETLERDIEIAHHRPLKVVEAEAVRRVKDQRDACEFGGPAADNAGFRAVCMNDLRPLIAEQAPQFQEGERIFQRLGRSHAGALDLREDRRLLHL